MNVFDSIITGLNEAVDYEKGKISAKKQLLEQSLCLIYLLKI